jgi:non-ribosomal peptide synthetase component F
VPGARADLGGLALEALPIPSRPVAAELSFVLAEGDDEILGLVEYDARLFDAARAARFADHFATLARSIVEDPDARSETAPRS